MEEKKFNYRYTAPTRSERQEIEDIRRHYDSGAASKTKLEQLRALDKRVKTVPTLVAWLVGIAGLLIFGLGLTMVLEWNIWIWGAVVACVGCIPMALAYPVYKWILARNKKKYGAQILTLSEELLNEEKGE
ncbi:MAG: hypothetical protein K2N84_04415 [Clostridia bacterium]|nr:hypothetical protein [Clostridia bacterium]